MRKLKLFIAAAALVLGGGMTASAQTDVTASYIGDLNRLSGTNGEAYGHLESNGIGWWNGQTTGLTGWHAFVKNGDAYESWTGSFGGAGVMMGRTMVLPEGNYTLSFEAFACNANNSADPATMPSAGDAVAFLTGKDNVDITNTASAGDATFHTVSYTFDVTTSNTAYEFGIKKLTDESKIDWCQIKNVKLTLNSTNIYPVDNSNVSAFTYSGSQEWHTNTWSTEGQRDGSRFQVPFHELWVGSGNKLADATIKGTYTPTETGVYKVSAWVRAMNESGGAVTGAKIYVGDIETDACAGSSVNGGKGRLGTYSVMADGVSGTPLEYGFKLENAEINWLSFKNVVITYLGSLPEEEVQTLLAQVPTGKMSATVQSTLNGYVEALNKNKSVANYNNLSLYINTALASIADYQNLANAIATAENYKPLEANANADYNAAIAAAQAVYDNANVEDCAATIASLQTALQTANVADYTYVTNNYSYAVTLGTWTTENAGNRSSQHWDGTNTSEYSEQNDGYNKNSWSCSYSQNLNLPAGKYVFKVAGRKSSDAAQLTMVVKNGETVIGTVSNFPNGDTGLGINTSGAADFSAEGTYANNNIGRGWQWRFVEFELTEPATVNVAINGSATDLYQYVGFCNATVQTDNADNVALMEALVALNDAKAAATLTKRTNVGTGVFQFDETNDNALWSAYETAKTNAEEFTLTAESTTADVKSLISALNAAKEAYNNNDVLVAPAADARYYLTVATAGHAKEGNAVVVSLGAASANNPTGYGFAANASPVAYVAGAYIFTKCEGNNYKISTERPEGTVYLTYGSLNNSAAGWATQQIQGTTDADAAGEFKIVASATAANVFNIYNIVHNDYIDCQDGGSLYTDTNIDKKDFKLVEASQATVALSIDADVKYATRIFPFVPTLPEGVVAYSCDAVSETNVTMKEVTTLEANKPYILFAENGASTELKGWGLATADSYTEGLLTGVYVLTDAPVGSYVLQNNTDGGVGFYKVAEGKQPKVGAYRAYLQVPAAAPEGVRETYFFGGEKPTGIEAIDVLTSGKAEIFNAAGARVPALQKGMNIVRKADGTSYKVIVK